jgi:hypothetical protein
MFVSTRREVYFKPKYSFEPIADDNGEEREDLNERGERKGYKKKSKYLPGEKLLMTMAKKEKKKKDDTLNFERITQSLTQILTLL